MKKIIIFLMLGSFAYAGINWRKLYIYLDTHESTHEWYESLTATQVASYLGTDPNSIRRSVGQIRYVIEADIENDRREAKFRAAKAFILNQVPTAVVERDGDDVVIRGYLK